MSRAPKHVIRALEAALKSAKMERVGFGMPHDRVSFNGGEPQGVTEFVKEKTRLYRSSWIIAPLEEALGWARGE